MYKKYSFDQDLELKKFSETPREDKPRFNWRGVINEESAKTSEITVKTEVE